jgi:tryptophanyl-tRNA synthetase
MVVGLDGRDKMSKSLNNHIELAATAEETLKKVMSAVTDPARRLRSDPGHPEVCNVYKLHQHFSPEVIENIAVECRSAARGCVDCKKQLGAAINAYLTPLRARRAEISADQAYVDKVIREGAAKAQAIAKVTITEVKQRMGLL